MTKSIYNQIMQCEKRMTLACFKTNVNKELSSLLNIISGIDLSSDPYTFVKIDGSIQFGVFIEYKFTYGIATIQANASGLAVKFTFECPSKLNILSFSNICNLSVDHNLNFIRAQFDDIISFSKRRHDSRLPIGFLNIKISHLSTLTEYDKRLSYSKFSAMIEDHINLNQGIDPRFKMKDLDFNNVFIQFIKLAAYSPTIFYSGFLHYPSYSDILTKPDSAIIEFINLFTSEYYNNNDELIKNIDKHILLNEMVND